MNRISLITRITAFAFGIAALTVSLSAANAQSIGINFSAGTRNVASSDQPGIVAGANWNNIAGASGTNIALVDNNNVATTAQLTFNSTGAFGGNSAPNTPNAATNTLYRAGLAGNNTVREITVTLTNIPFAQYDLYVFASQDNTPTNTLSVSDSITTFYYRSSGSNNSGVTALTQTTSTNSGAPTVGPAQYSVFTGKTTSGVTLTTGGSVNGVIANQIFGIQIVNAAVVPESSTLALVLPTLGVFAVGAIVVRRNRKPRKVNRRIAA